MDDRPCTHVYAPCEGPCSSYLYRAEEVTKEATTDRHKANRELLAYAAAFVFVVAFGLLGWAVVSQGAENWQNTITANEDQ